MSSKSRSDAADQSKSESNSTRENAEGDVDERADSATKKASAKPKQIRLALGIGEHDLSRRLERAREMLKEGHAVCKFVS